MNGSLLLLVWDFFSTDCLTYITSIQYIYHCLGNDMQQLLILPCVGYRFISVFSF